MDEIRCKVKMKTKARQQESEAIIHVKQRQRHIIIGNKYGATIMEREIWKYGKNKNKSSNKKVLV